MRIVCTSIDYFVRHASKLNRKRLFDPALLYFWLVLSFRLFTVRSEFRVESFLKLIQNHSHEVSFRIEKKRNDFRSSFLIRILLLRNCEGLQFTILQLQFEFYVFISLCNVESRNFFQRPLFCKLLSRFTVKRAFQIFRPISHDRFFKKSVEHDRWVG